MKVEIYKTRSVFTNRSKVGTINENYIEVLEFTFPEELEDYVKYIEIEAENEEGKLEYVDRIEDNKFALSNSLTKYDNLQMQVVCKKYVENKAVTVFKSNIFNVAVDSSLNIMEDVEEEQKSLLDRIEAELQEVYQGMEEFKTEIVEDANSRFNTNVTEKTQAFNENAETKTNAFNSNYDEKLGTFNTNATSKLEEYNNNDTAKTGAYNTNATEKLGTYNTNATNKVAEYNSNAESKLNAYNTNATEKLAEYDSRVTKLHEDLDETQEKVEQYNTNINNKYTQYNTNAEQKLSAYNQNATTKTSEYNTNAQTKLQEYNDNASALMQSVDDLEAKHDAEVAELNEKIADLQEEVAMASDLIPTGDESGSDITVNDSVRYYFKKFIPGGKSEQETFRGVNLCTKVDLQSSENIRFYFNRNLLEKTFTISFIPNEAINNTLYLDSSNGTSALSSISGNANTKVSKTFTLTDEVFERLQTATWYNFRLYKSGANFEVPSEPQIENGSTATEYEKYVGGQPAPNPNYECPIRNVGDNVNLFDEDTVSFVTGILDDNGNPTGSTTSHYTANFYKVKPNTKYTLAGTLSLGNTNSRLYFYNKDKEWISRTADSIANQITFTTPNNCYYIKIQVVNEITLKTNDVILVEGTSTSYRPYNCGNVEVEVENANITSGDELYQTMSAFDDTKCSETTVDNKEVIRFMSNAYRWQMGFNAINYKFKENTQYTIRGLFKRSSNGILYMQIKYKDGSVQNVYSNTDGWNELRMVSTADKTIDIIGFSYSTATYWYLDKSSWFVAEGDTTDYIEHEEQTVTFPLEEVQVLHETDTIEDKIMQRRKTLALDGTEEWVLTNAEVGQFRLAINDMTKNPILSNYFGYKLTYSASGKPYLRPANGSLFAEIGTEFLPEVSVVAWKNWLAEKYANGTPLTLEYELETPIKIPFTEPQKTAKAQIDKLYSYKGTTHITSNANLDVTYRKDPETEKTKEHEYLQSQIDELKLAVLSQANV